MNLKRFENFEKTKQAEEQWAGQQAFRIFLQLVNQQDLEFIKKGYLNTGNYYYFFFTAPIPQKEKLLTELELKRSLKKGYQTLQKIQNQKLSFFWGIKGKWLEYGFLANQTEIVYKIGRFMVDKSYLKNMPRFKCMWSVRDRLKEANLTNMKILHQIRQDLSDFWPSVETARIKILDEQRIKKDFPIENFKPADVQENLLSLAARKFAQKHKWNRKVSIYTEIGQEKIHIYFRLWEKIPTNPLKKKY
jgi:hypothetical protein